MYTVSFIVVNYNGSEFLRRCLDSIANQSISQFETIVVDNGSNDDSVKIITNEYPHVRLVELKKNTGFTGGNIAGYTLSKGKYIALINNDVRLDSKWAYHMIQAIESNKNIGMCSSKIIISGTNRIDSVGDRFTSAFTGTKVGEYQLESDFMKPMAMHGACAGAALYKRTMFNDIGFLNNLFFLNHEDTDLNLRAWLAGYKCLFVPNAIAHHDVNRTIGTLSDTSVYYFSRNNIWVWLLNVPYHFMLRNILQRIVYEITAGFFYCVIHKKFRPYFKGKVDAIVSMKKIRKIRKTTTIKVRLSNQEISHGLIPIYRHLIVRISKL